MAKFQDDNNIFIERDKDRALPGILIISVMGLIGLIVLSVAVYNHYKRLEAVAQQKKDDIEIAKPWLEIAIDCKKILTHTKKFTAIFYFTSEWMYKGY